MQRTDHKKKKSGAALVIALGFLAILAIIALAFAVQMRTERLAGGGYLAGVQTSHLLDTCLARAMADIDRTMAGRIYPPFDAIGSPGIPAEAPRLGESFDFRTEQEFLPGEGSPLHDASMAVLDREARWQQVVDAQSQLVGRVGYAIVDLSGLLDANAAGGCTGGTNRFPRAEGASPHELRLSPQLLDELAASGRFELYDGSNVVGTTSDAALAFVHNRDTSWQRFDTLRDIFRLNRSGSAAVFVRPPRHFAPFSLYPNEPAASDGTMVDLAHTPDRAAFVAAMARAGLSNGESIYEAYLDYVDPDDLPRDLRGGCTERVPMINEIWLDGLAIDVDTIDPTNIEFQASGQLHIETWFPFDGKPPALGANNFRFLPGSGPRFGADELVDADQTGKDGFIALEIELGPGIGFCMYPKLRFQSRAQSDRFQTTDYSFEFDESLELSSPLAEADAEATLATFSLDNIDLVPDRPATGTVDRVAQIEFGMSLTNQTKLARQTFGRYCIDPRVNHDFCNPLHWVAESAATSNRVNMADNDPAWGEEAGVARKSELRLYVRNDPMRNAAELGFLSTGAPWRTIRLYGGDAPLNPVLDYFRVGTSDSTTPFTKGLVNLNSTGPSVLATAFFDAPIQRFPGEKESAVGRVDAAQALQLGKNLSARTTTAPCRALSFIGNALAANVPGSNRMSDAQRESIVANSYRLFGWRSNLFAVVLAAQRAVDANRDDSISDDEVLASQRAVVYVWRDPATGKAACVFYGLSDTLDRARSGGDWAEILDAFRP